MNRTERNEMTVHCIWNALNTDCRLARASQTWRFRPIPTGPSLTYRGVYDSFVREFSKPYRACLGVVPPSTAESPHDRNFFFSVFHQTIKSELPMRRRTVVIGLCSGRSRTFAAVMPSVACMHHSPEKCCGEPTELTEWGPE